MDGIKTKIVGRKFYTTILYLLLFYLIIYTTSPLQSSYVSTHLLSTRSCCVLLPMNPSRLMPAPSPPIGDLESVPSSQPQPSPSNTTSESQAPPSPQSPPGARDPLPHTINESQRNNTLDAKPDLEKELKKTLLSLCFGAALQIATQCKQVAESEINRSTISLLSLGTAAIFGSLFTSHFIGEKMPNASRVLDKVAFFLAATTFFFAIATPCPLSIKCAIWALYIISLIAIATCNFLLYSGGALTHGYL
ncbi:hypothetical protein IMY05_007G0116400 [Salix suchowensis]|nr:hypothetical protein IMY05_007G0116400 [Salix suchowensis]